MAVMHESTPKTVLWVVDISREPQKAFQSIERFKQAGSEIHILYVGDDIGHHPSWYGDLEPEHADHIHDRSSEKAKERLDHICEIYLQGCPLYIRHSSVGDALEQISELLNKESFDLIVIPSRLENEHPPLQNGEVTFKGAAPVPVMTIT